MTSDWSLSRRAAIEGVDVAYDILGDGPPVVLVHGFPSNSYIWRDVAPVLAKTHRVHVYDLPGQGASERRDGMDVSDPLQARVLKGLIEHWQLARPAGIFHDIGCTYGMWAYHFEGCRFERIALVSAAMMVPCVSAATLHAKAHLEAYRTMPVDLYELIVEARIRSTTYKPMSEASLEAYEAPWKGRQGQALWFNRVAQLSEDTVARLQSALGPMDVPVRIIWGIEDTWIPVDQATRLQGLIPGAELCLVEGGGHFLMEDAPDEAAALLVEFLALPA